MDRYIVRTESPNRQQICNKHPSKRMKQATIYSLGGVVVVDDILLHKSRLQLEGQTSDVLIDSLKQLRKKIPCRRVLLSTKIGHVVNKLRKHADPAVVSEAKIVHKKWVQFYKDLRDKPQIEVRCDNKTEKLRASGRTLISDALNKEHQQLAEAIEREVFEQCAKLSNVKYRRTMRTIIFLLKNHESARHKVIAGELSITNLVKENKKS